MTCLSTLRKLGGRPDAPDAACGILDAISDAADAACGILAWFTKVFFPRAIHPDRVRFLRGNAAPDNHVDFCHRVEYRDPVERPKFRA